VARKTEMEKRCQKFVVALVVLVVVAVVVVVLLAEGCGKSSASTSSSAFNSLVEEGEVAEVPTRSPVPSSESIEGGAGVGKEAKADLGELAVEAWFADRPTFARSLRSMLLQVGVRVFMEPEGAGHLLEGAEEGDFDCLFRWSVLDVPFEGVSSEVFASQFPGWSCSAKIVFFGNLVSDPEKTKESLVLWMALVASIDPSPNTEVRWHDENISAVFSWREGCNPEEAIPEDLILG